MEHQHLIRGMSVRARATDTEGNDLCLRVDTFEFLKEGDRAALSIASCRLSKELLTGRLDGLSKPSCRLFLAPAVSTTTFLDSHFSIVGCVGCELLHELVDCNLTIREG